MSMLTNLARGAKVELIAQLASSYEAFDGGTLMKNVSPHNIRDYFRKYGSAVRKFDHIADGDIYIGYVKIRGKPEFLSAIVMAGGNAVASAFDSIFDQSDDFLNLLAKKEFADIVALAVRRATVRMVELAPPPPPLPSQPTKPDTSVPKPSSAESTILLILGLAVVLFLILVFVKITVENSYSSLTQPAPERVDYARAPDQYDAPLPSSSEEPLPNPVPNEELTGPLVNTALTYRMLDSIMSGVDEFLTVSRSSGISGAVWHSKDCLSRADASAQIDDLDKCAAFDFTAQFADNAASIENGFPTDEYFRETNARLETAYARLPEGSATRMALIKGQTAVVLRDTFSGTTN